MMRPLADARDVQRPSLVELERRVREALAKGKREQAEGYARVMARRIKAAGARRRAV
jgi:hypothetical protein